MSNTLSIGAETYDIVDALEYITLADSFVKNKIGTGHGEAKLYVGNENGRLFEFFGDFNLNCFYLKSDFESFLETAELEFKDPQQEYNKKHEMPRIYDALKTSLNKYQEDILHFELYRVDVEPPRVYVNSNSHYYDFMRSIGLPNISYLSVLKLRDKHDDIYYYFKIFIDYKSDIVSYVISDEKHQLESIRESAVITERKKETLIQARIGQGEYRRKLLEECPFCIFTMVNDERLLIASHIKPWSKSNDKEKIDPKNGLALTPTYDSLFDRGFISFNEDKTLIVSPWLSPMNQKRLQIHDGKLISRLPVDGRRNAYLAYHRANILTS
jgi:putative restriction endonuclease